ncbi:hypothetical protein BDQ12DRAFT_736111 [Crucibulum laeve]|uniref:F-box domain-containing protein n=1 Tax=Crucibulum laeve TaxID=68775 RepID=A0A5C3M0B2_9AGAR|nr:hypothetical protein BDQ12DRAFT_736111 [Crucibulum laeve]
MTTIGDKAVHLVYDVLLLALDLFRDDYQTLFLCSLVNWEFNRVASRFLYSKVALIPPFRPVLDLKDSGALPQNSNLGPASLPRNAPYVLNVEIGGFLSSRPPPRNTLPVTLTNSIRAFVNLNRIELTPIIYHEDTFTETLGVLKEAKSLHELAVNACCMDDLRAPLLAKIDGIEKLTLHDPTRAILQLLPDWLERLSNKIMELHLKDNCGSVTPGVLKSFLPHVRNRLRAFTLGLSYSLTDEDVFNFLGQLPKLEMAELKYYWQMKAPPRQPPLPNLRTLTVNSRRLLSKFEVNAICKWIRRAITWSPIEELRVIQDEDDDDLFRVTGAHPSWESLIDHLTSRHTQTLRVLDLRLAFIKAETLKSLLAKCTALEELYLCAGKDSLGIFSDYSAGLTELYSVSFEIRNTKRRSYRNLGSNAAADIMRSGPRSLRRLAVNGVEWEGTWILTETSDIQFLVQEIKRPKAPWERT